MPWASGVLVKMVKGKPALAFLVPSPYICPSDEMVGHARKRRSEEEEEGGETVTDGEGSADGGADLRGQRPHHPRLQEHTAVRVVAGLPPPRAPLPALLRLVVPSFSPPRGPVHIEDRVGGGFCGLPAAAHVWWEVVESRGGGGRAPAEGTCRGGGDGAPRGGGRRGWCVPLGDVCVHGTKKKRAFLPLVAACLGGSEVRFRSDAILFHIQRQRRGIRKPFVLLCQSC